MESKIVDKTFFKFILVGVINTAFGTSIMFIAYNFLGFGYWISSAANYILGSILSYILNKHFTFENKSKSVLTIVKFIINIVLCYLIAYGLAQPIIRYMLSNLSKSIQDNISMFVGMGLFVIFNYLGQRFFAFK